MSYDGALQLGNRTTVGHYDCHASMLSTALSLDNAYNPGVAGKVHCSRQTLPKAGTVSTVYYYITQITGAPTTVDLELRTGTLYAPNMAAGGLIQAKAHNPGATLGWQAVTGWTASAAVGNLWLLIGDKDGAGGSFVRIQEGVGPAPATNLPQNFDVVSFSSNDGGVTLSIAARPPCTPLIFADASFLGNVITGLAGPVDNRRRGFRFSPPWTMKGMEINTQPAPNVTGVEIWQGDAGPSGTPAATSTWIVGDLVGNISGVLIPDFTFTANAWYNVVLTYSGASSAPLRLEIGTGSDATLRGFLPFGGSFYWVEDNGGVWSYNTNGYPGMSIVLKSLP